MQRIWQHVLMILLLGLWSTAVASLVYAGGGEQSRPSWESQRYLIEGVHCLINEGDRDAAEDFFRRAILSSSFHSLSTANSQQSIVNRGLETKRERWVVAEAFYFLGKIHYEKAILDTGGRRGGEVEREGEVSSIQNVSWAKKYLKKAEEYGIVYDRLHPPLLDEINRKYPGVDASISEPSRDKVKIAIEIPAYAGIGGSYQIGAVKVNQHAEVTESEFTTNEEFDLECGARYKVEPDIRGGYRSIYRALTALGIGLIVWLTRG